MAIASRQFLGAAAWVAGVAVWLVLQLAAIAQWENPSYDWGKNYISDIGNTTCGPFTVPGGESFYVCSPGHDLMNIGFVVSGALTALGAVLLWRYWPQSRLTRIAGVLFVLTGLGRVIVGFGPEDVNITMHMIGALAQSPSSVAVLLSAIAIRDTSPALARTGMALGALGLVGAVLALGGQAGITAFHLGVGPGLTERLSSHPIQVWLVVIGTAVMASAFKASRRSEIPATA
ncbi:MULTISPECIES: DUF998 domain-containing protein [Streptomyces violaceusniger group]|uniref:DUF998 domain-containing protein n=2 Tax=Streptomyces rhizosphaericus TaxID=114699 RepID=A0ABN1RSE6_9ACTN|nr:MULTISPECIES: DUF998 domain-containing protein [Streptomyces violaceusniger group]